MRLNVIDKFIENFTYRQLAVSLLKKGYYEVDDSWDESFLLSTPTNIQSAISMCRES